AGGEHEAVAVRPDGILRIEAQEALPKAVDGRRHPHGRAGVTGVGLLNGVDGQGSNRVYAQLIEFHEISKKVSVLQRRSIHTNCGAANLGCSRLLAGSLRLPAPQYAN